MGSEKKIYFFVKIGKIEYNFRTMEEKNFTGNSGADLVHGDEQKSRDAGGYDVAEKALQGEATRIDKRKKVLDDIATLVDEIKSGEAYDAFIHGLESLQSRDERDRAQRDLSVYSKTLEKFCETLRKKRDDLKEKDWISAVQQGIKQVPLAVAAAEKAAVRAWDDEARGHERFLQAHGLDLGLEQNNYTHPKDIKIQKALPKFERSMPKFMALFLIFFVVEAGVNGILYAQVQEGLIAGWLVAGGVAAGVLFFGWLSGILSSFLKGFENDGFESNPRRGEDSSLSGAEAGSNRSKMVILALLVIVALLGGVYFYTHSEELIAKHGLRGTLVAVGAIVVVVGLIMFLWFGKGGTKQDVERAKNKGYIPRPVWKRLSYGFGAFFSLLTGIAMIMVAYLYREEMAALDLAGGLDEDGAGAVVMQGVWARFGALDFLPGEGIESIILLLVNFAGFGFAVYKGHWMNGPFQNYKNSRIQYEGCGEKYDERRNYIRTTREKCDSALSEIVNRFPNMVGATHDLANEINEGLLQKRWDDACEAVKKRGRNADLAAPSIDNIPPPKLINADEWGAVEDMLTSARGNG